MTGSFLDVVCLFLVCTAHALFSTVATSLGLELLISLHTFRIFVWSFFSVTTTVSCLVALIIPISANDSVGFSVLCIDLKCL